MSSGRGLMTEYWSLYRKRGRDQKTHIHTHTHTHTCLSPSMLYPVPPWEAAGKRAITNNGP
jgi:hypothetical protein